jgi:hypothetical protein
MSKLSEIILQFGGWGFAGLLLGLIAVWWIDPNTAGGTVLVLAVCFASLIVVRGIALWIGKARARRVDNCARPSQPIAGGE